MADPDLAANHSLLISKAQGKKLQHITDKVQQTIKR